MIVVSGGSRPIIINKKNLSSRQHSASIIFLVVSVNLRLLGVECLANEGTKGCYGSHGSPSDTRVQTRSLLFSYFRSRRTVPV
jgi:hypothetical protein